MKKTRPALTIIIFIIGWVIMYADGNILSPVMGSIGEEWSLNQTQLGLMSTVFIAAYAFMLIPTGNFADKFGSVKVLDIGFIVFGIGTYLSGASATFGIFLMMRALTGIGEGTYYGSQYGISSTITPIKYRGLDSAIINSGLAFGISLGFMSSSYFTYTLNKGWPFPYNVFAIPPIIVGILIAIYVVDNSLKEKKRIVQATDKVELKNIFTKYHIFVYILIFRSLYGFYGLLTWLPYYLQTARDIEASQTGNISYLVPWASIPGAILFGFLSDRIKSRTPLIIGLAFAGALCQIIIPYTEKYSFLIVGFCLYGLLG
ncbi:MFS transporter [Niallia taxi]|nr:MFS transporter [Niallia taxi]MDE5052308.1 MFS transporter [Niallia taxi]